MQAYFIQEIYSTLFCPSTPPLIKLKVFSFLFQYFRLKIPNESVSFLFLFNWVRNLKVIKSLTESFSIEFLQTMSLKKLNYEDTKQLLGNT